MQVFTFVPVTEIMPVGVNAMHLFPHGFFAGALTF